MRKFVTWIDDGPPYASLSAVPAPLQDVLRRAHESGLDVEHLVKVYELPAEWVTEILQK